MDVRFARVFQDVLDDRKLAVTPDLSPENTPSWDSFAQVKLILSLEEEFGVSFSIDEVAGVHTAGGLADALERKGVRLDQ